MWTLCLEGLLVAVFLYPILLGLGGLGSRWLHLDD
jgi:hypothetical protein